jgi:hypothetical protein
MLQPRRPKLFSQPTVKMFVLKGYDYQVIRLHDAKGLPQYDSQSKTSVKPQVHNIPAQRGL